MNTKRFFLFTISTLILCWNQYLFSQELYFIDAHSQADHNIELETVVDRMRKAGIAKTILAARGKRKSRDIAALSKQYPDEIIAAVRTKGRHYKNNSDKYFKKLARQVESGHFNAMAEVILYHAQKGDRAEKVKIFPDDRRVSAALDYAKQKNWPLIIHIEFASLHGDLRKNYLEKLTDFLINNNNHPVALIHMAQLSASEADNLLRNHKNLYFLTSHANTIAVRRSNQPWINMFKNKQLTPEWEKIIKTYPKQIVFSIDNVWPEHWLNGYKEQVTLWRNALKQLPEDVAHAIAHGNAETLWNIKHTH